MNLQTAVDDIASRVGIGGRHAPPMQVEDIVVDPAFDIPHAMQDLPSRALMAVSLL